jgi:gas vesicle protein
MHCANYIIETASSSDLLAFWTTLTGAVVGAIVGGIIAYRLARKSSEELLARDRIALTERKKTDTVRGLVKLLRIVNELATIHRSIEEMIEKADQAGHVQLDLWQKVIPTVGFSTDNLKFEAEEISVFMAAKEYAFLNKLILIADRHFTTGSAFGEYAARREKLTDQLKAEMKGEVGTTILTKDQIETLGPRMFALEQLITQLRAMAKENYEDSLEISKQFGAKAQQHFQDPEFPEIELNSSPQKA